VDQIKIEIPAVERHLMAQRDEVHEFSPFALKHVDGIEQIEMGEAGGPHQAIAEEGVFEEGAGMHVGGSGELGAEGMLAVVGMVRGGGTQLETIKIIPVKRAVNHVNRRSIIFKSPHRQGILAHPETPILVEFVIQIQKIRVVKKMVAASICDDSLAEIVGKTLSKTTAHLEIEIAAIESVFIQGVHVIVVEIRTDFQHQSGEFMPCSILGCHFLHAKKRKKEEKDYF